LRLAGAALLAWQLWSGCAGVDPYEVALERGRVALALGETEDAADAYRSALAFRPDDPLALHGLARTHVARGDGEAALPIFARLAAVDPDYLDHEAATDHHFALYQAARDRTLRGDSAGALRLLRRLQQLAPAHDGLAPLAHEVLLVEGARLRVAGDEAAAAQLLTEALGPTAAGPDAAAQVASALLAIGREDAAIPLLSDALLRRPHDATLRALMERALEIRYPNSPLDGRGRPRRGPR
jgi:tetratricopeptide (TPR) repeat protein